MIKKTTLKTVKTSLKSGFNFSKFYFSKPASVVLVTTYATILLLVLSTLGFSKIISPKTTEEPGIPPLPNSEPFAFLPADNIEIPELGDVEEPTKESAQKEPEKTPEKIATKEPASNVITTVEAVRTVEVPKETVKEVVKTVEIPKEVIKTVEVEKEVVKEVQKEAPEEAGTEQTYFENYTAPDPIPYTPEIYENFPDIDEDPAEEK